MIGVYKITSPSNKIYIGSSINIKRRESTYKNANCIKQHYLYNSIKKYGWENHIFEIIEECEINELYKKERCWGEFHNVLNRENGLNLSLPGYDEIKGFVSVETRNRISQSLMGKTASEETKKKLSERRYTDEQKEAMSKRKIGKKCSIETRNKMAASRMGRVCSEKCKQIVTKLFSKPVLNTQTNVIYPSVKIAAISVNLNEDQLSNRLRGITKNKTNLIYAEI